MKLTSLPEDSPPEPETQASEHSAIAPRTPGDTDRYCSWLRVLHRAIREHGSRLAVIKPTQFICWIWILLNKRLSVYRVLAINLGLRCQIALVIVVPRERLMATVALRWLYYRPRMSHTCASARTLYSSTYADAAWLLCSSSPLLLIDFFHSFAFKLCLRAAAYIYALDLSLH